MYYKRYPETIYFKYKRLYINASFNYILLFVNEFFSYILDYIFKRSATCELKYFKNLFFYVIKRNIKKHFTSFVNCFCLLCSINTLDSNCSSFFSKTEMIRHHLITNLSSSVADCKGVLLNNFVIIKKRIIQKVLFSITFFNTVIINISMLKPILFLYSMLIACLGL